MKPRLESAPLTEWDQGIYSWINQRWLFRHGTCEGAVSFYSRADRRDADQMFSLGRIPRMGRTSAAHEQIRAAQWFAAMCMHRPDPT